MPVYIVTGKLGSGKTLSMVGRIKAYVESGRPVATNIGLDLRSLVRQRPCAPVVRLPDRPTFEDFSSLGQVHATGREELNGCIVLDECGTWLNSRTWGDKGRQAVIDWMLHSRKYGWDIYLIVQNITLLDKQVRDAMAEYVVTCRRLDRLRIPVLGRVVSWLTFGLCKGTMPQVHLALVRYGMGPGSVHAETWMYRGVELYAAYQTVQIISDESPGMHSLVWYATAAEIAKWPPKPKPKRELVKLVMGLPAELRIPTLRRLSAPLPSKQTPASGVSIVGAVGAQRLTTGGRANVRPPSSGSVRMAARWPCAAGSRAAAGGLDLSLGHISPLGVDETVYRPNLRGTARASLGRSEVQKKTPDAVREHWPGRIDQPNAGAADVAKCTGPAIRGQAVARSVGSYLARLRERAS